MRKPYYQQQVQEQKKIQEQEEQATLEQFAKDAFKDPMQELIEHYAKQADESKNDTNTTSVLSKNQTNSTHVQKKKSNLPDPIMPKTGLEFQEVKAVVKKEETQMTEAELQADIDIKIQKKKEQQMQDLIDRGANIALKQHQKVIENLQEKESSQERGSLKDKFNKAVKEAKDEYTDDKTELSDTLGLDSAIQGHVRTEIPADADDNTIKDETQTQLSDQASEGGQEGVQKVKDLATKLGLDCNDETASALS